MSLGRAHFRMLVAALLGGVLGACPPSGGPRTNASAVEAGRAGSGSEGRHPTVAQTDGALTRAMNVGVGGAAQTLDAASTSEFAASPAPSAATPVSRSAAPNAEHEIDGPTLLDEEGRPLAQTTERPSSNSAAFARRIAALAQAIIEGDTERALGSFFPLAAYRQVKDVAKPERDYEYRLVANFERDVLSYHRALGVDAKQATFAGVSVRENDVKWMAPGSEGNKLGYFRVLRSRLHFALPAGRTRDFELTSLISWRGEWYVVHLHGFE